MYKVKYEIGPNGLCHTKCKTFSDKRVASIVCQTCEYYLDRIGSNVLCQRFAYAPKRSKRQIDIKALKEAIYKWGLIVYNGGADHGTSNCALCEEYHDIPGNKVCSGCPIREKTGSAFCQKTPYSKWKKNVYNFPVYADTPDRKKAAKAMLTYLQDLLKEIDPPNPIWFGFDRTIGKDFTSFHKQYIASKAEMDKIWEQQKLDIDIKALNGSVKKWKGIVYDKAKDGRNADCPLCQVYNKSGSNLTSCHGCPIYINTGKRHCKGTPYENWTTYTDNCGVDNVIDNYSRSLATKMLIYLRKILVEYGNKMSRLIKYEVFVDDVLIDVKTMGADWSYARDYSAQMKLYQDTLSKAKAIPPKYIRPVVAFECDRIPNCAICTWYRLDKDSSHMPYDVCVSQGGQDCDDVYNNDICKKLYYEKDNIPNKDTIGLLLNQIYNIANCADNVSNETFQQILKRINKIRKEIK